MSLKFTVLANDKNTLARTTSIITAHGEIKTPVFMPVGTFGTVRFLMHEHLEQIKTQIILGNTYHLFLRPGANILKEMGGYHSFIHWNKPILTDSGGYQIFSLPHQRTLSEKGVKFKSYVDQSYKIITPEENIEFQEIIGSDIMMALDICVPSTSPKEVAKNAMHQTHRWAKRCLSAKKRNDTSLFGIIQGAIFKDLRTESAEALATMELNEGDTRKTFDGFAIGGLAVGETDEQREEFTHFTSGLMPANKPKYLMGVGTPHDLVRSIKHGVDMFDCIIPTNHAKQGTAYTWQGKVKLRRNVYSTVKDPLSTQCACFVCQKYSCAYLYQLIKCGEPTGWALISYHNTYFYEELTKRIRLEIESGTYETFYNWFIANVPD
jgi:queuine tRNA-ribosyltransferase